jgi:hypothetical protein
MGHYRGESQTLTTGAESNLLKFKEMIGALTPEEAARWDEIKKSFRRNQFTKGADSSDPVGRVVAQLALFQSGLETIGQTLQNGISREPAALRLDLAPVERSLGAIEAALQKPPAPPVAAPAPLVIDLAPVTRGLASLQTALAEHLSRPAPAPTPVVVPAEAPTVGRELGEGFQRLGEQLSQAIQTVQSAKTTDKVDSLSHELEMIHSTLASLKDLSRQQRDHLRQAQELLATRAKQGTVEIELTQEMLANEQAFLEKFHQVLEQSQKPGGAEPPKPPAPPPLPKG